MENSTEWKSAFILLLTIERIREFVVSVQLIIYAKQNGVKYTTISATGAMAQMGWRRLLLGHGDEVAQGGCKAYPTMHLGLFIYATKACVITISCSGEELENNRPKQINHIVERKINASDPRLNIEEKQA